MSIILDKLSTYNPISTDIIRWLRMTYLTYQSHRLPHITHSSILQQSGIISVSDLDELGHCNNMRYLREAEFCRIYFMMRSNIWSSLITMSKQRNQLCGFVLANSYVRYRQQLLLGDKFVTTCKILCWNAKSVFFEQTIICNNRIHFYVIFQQSTINCTANELMSYITSEKSPDMPPHVKQWLTSQESSKSHIPFSENDVITYLANNNSVSEQNTTATSKL